MIENIIIFKSKVMQLPLCSPWHLIYDSTMKITTSNDQYAKKILYVIDKKIEQNIMSNILWWWITDKRHRYTQIKKMYLPLYLPWYFKNRFNNETYDLKLLIRKKNDICHQLKQFKQNITIMIIFCWCTYQKIVISK